MGHHLWTSPVTGYRRNGTRLSELRRVLNAGTGARAILEPIQCCASNAPAKEMQHLLNERGFDVAGVMERKDGPVIGFIFSKDLMDGQVEKYIKPFSAAHLISDATDIGGLIKILNARSRTFVLVGSEVRGIVTLADLNKPPIRLYLFGLVSLFEMHLRFWIRKAYPDTSWQEFLKAKRVEKANDLQSRRRKRNQQIDVLDCLQLCDKQELFKKNQELVKMLEVVGGKKELDRFFTAVEDLRNRLAHSQQDLVEAPLGPT